MRSFLKDFADDFADCDPMEKLLVVLMILLVFVIAVGCLILLRVLLSPWEVL